MFISQGTEWLGTHARLRLASGRGDRNQAVCMSGSILTPRSEELMEPRGWDPGSRQGGDAGFCAKVAAHSGNQPLSSGDASLWRALPPAQAGPRPLCGGESPEHRLWAIHQQLLCQNLHLGAENTAWHLTH